MNTTPSPDSDRPSSPQAPADPSIRRRAAAEAASRRWLLLHAAAYAVVNTLTVIVDMSDGGGWRFQWTLLGWGIGLAAHAVIVLSPVRPLARWEQRQADRIAARLQDAETLR